MPHRAAGALGALALAALAVACSADSDRSPGSQRPDVILVTWDTVRADAVGAGRGPDGGERPSATPRFDRLARTGVAFAKARSPVPITLPAHTSLLSGHWPASHGVRENGRSAVPPGLPLLQEELGRSGYATGAFVSASVLDRRYGLARGFDRYDDAVEPRSRELTVPTRSAERTVDAALDWLEQVPADRPLLLWLHLYDPHRIWRAPAAWGERYADPYRAEIAYADDQTGRLLDALAASGRLARSAVVVTSDHGEGLGEHGEQTHSYFAYDSTLRVPLLFWLGEELGTDLAIERGVRIDGPASLVDVMPTLLELLELPVPTNEGRSLAASLGGAPVPARLQPVECVTPAYGFGAAPVFGLITEENESWFSLPRPERYDLGRDPGQLDNLYRPADAEAAQRLFARWDWRWPPDADAEHGLELDVTAREQLRSLGYTVGSGAPAESDADPKDRVELSNFLTVNRQQLLPGDALARARALAAEYGPLPALARFEVDMLGAMGRSREALEALERAVAEHPADRELRQLFEEQKQLRQRQLALAQAIRAALAENPDHPSAHRDLALTLHQLQELEEAETYYREALRRKPQESELRANLANLLLTREQPERALAVLEPVAGGAGADPRLRCQRARILAFHLDRRDEAIPALRRCRDAGIALSEMEESLLER